MEERWQNKQITSPFIRTTPEPPPQTGRSTNTNRSTWVHGPASWEIKNSHGREWSITMKQGVQMNAPPIGRSQITATVRD
jgi:hypothetical protein